MMGYCETDDVRTALQKVELSGAVNATDLENDIEGVSSWLRKQSGRHWYDTGGSTTLIPTATRPASNVRLDVPSSPHRQDRQLFRHEQGVRYPVSKNGPYVRIKLPHGFVSSLTALYVRQRDGSVQDWVAAGDKTEGRGEDYYVLEEDQEGYGRSVLYIHEASIGPRTDFGGLLTLDYDYGLDEQDESWSDVRRGVALLTAAQVVDDDNVLAQIPDNGQLVGVETQAERLADRAMQYLGGYL